MNLFKSVVVALPLLALLVSADILIRKGNDATRKIKIFSSLGDRRGGLTMVITSSTKTGNGSFDFVRQFVNIDHMPCPRVTMRRVNGSVSLDQDVSSDDAVSGTADFSANSHSFVISHLFMWTDVNATIGVQKEDVNLSLVYPLCGPQAKLAGLNLAWDNTTVETSIDADTNATVYTVTKCANLDTKMGSFGQMCFQFTIGDESYNKDGVKKAPGQIKIDKIFTPSATVSRMFGDHKPGFMASYTVSSDAGDLAFNNGSKVQDDNSTTLVQKPDVEVKYTGGAVSYLNYNKTVVCNAENEATNANVYLTVIDTTVADVTFNFTFRGDSLAVTGQATKKIMLFGVDKTISSCDNFAWDPETGYSDSTAGTNVGTTDNTNNKNAGFQGAFSNAAVLLFSLVLSLLMYGM